MKLNNKSGFTLLEIIIVIIIVGVLASLALPKMFRTVEYSRSTEALQTMNSLRQSIERYGLASNSILGATMATIDMQNPSSTTFGNTGAHFNYNFAVVAAAAPFSYTITATRIALDGGTAGNTIVLTVNGAANTITRSGTGAFIGIG